MSHRVSQYLPKWAHPRFPLVANELRRYSPVNVHVVQVRQDFSHILSILNRFFLISTLIILIGGGPVFGFFLLVLTFMLSPVLFMVSEILYTRVLVSIPAQTSEMIAGEIERGTWDIVLATPLPRYQIIFSKFAALFWNAQPALGPILLSRFLLIAYLTTERNIIAKQRFTFEEISTLGLVGLLIVFVPLLELWAFSNAGMLISTLTTSTWNSNILSWGAWIFYRTCAAMIFALAYASTDAETLVLLMLIIIFPHWTLLLFWLLLRGDASSFLMAFGAIYLVVPAIIGLAGLALTITLIKHTWT